jgi:hypothetical protein
MNTAVAYETARQMIDSQVFFSGKFYFVFTVLMFSAACAGSFISEFFRGRIRMFAFKTRYGVIPHRREEAPPADVDDKSRAERKDWALREYNTLRRYKLEELLTALFELDHWLERERDVMIFRPSAETAPPPINTIHLIASLYFPELDVEAVAVVGAYRDHVAWIEEFREKLEAAPRGPEHEAILAVYDMQYCENGQPLAAAVKALEEKARLVMKNVIGMGF